MDELLQKEWRERDDSRKAKDRSTEKERREEFQQKRISARAVALKITCPICKTRIANHKQLVGHYGSKHPNETSPAESSRQFPFLGKSCRSDKQRFVMGQFGSDCMHLD